MGPLKPFQMFLQKIISLRKLTFSPQSNDIVLLNREGESKIFPLI